MSSDDEEKKRLNELEANVGRPLDPVERVWYREQLHSRSLDDLAKSVKQKKADNIERADDGAPHPER